MVTNRQKASFTLREYEKLLKHTSRNYRCVGFEVLDDPDSLPERFAIIRHDIDISPKAALDLARIEAENNIRATYTILLTGEFYSPFEQGTRKVLQEIAGLGHDVGLHFDAAWHKISSEAELEGAIRFELEILNRLLGFEKTSGDVKMFSFHNTTPFTMACRQTSYAGLRNAYAGILQSQVSYTSDSNGYWIHRSWEELLSEAPLRIQVLTHPEWWNDRDGEPAEKVCQHLDLRSKRAWESYCISLRTGGRCNKSGLDEASSCLPLLIPREGEQILRLWLDGRREPAFLGLYRCFERLTKTMVSRYLQRMAAPAREVAALLSDHKLQLDPVAALALLTSQPVSRLLGFSGSTYRAITNARNSLIHGFPVRTVNLPRHFNALCVAMVNVAKWSKAIPKGGNSPASKTPASDVGALSAWLTAGAERLGLGAEEVAAFLGRHREIFPEGD
ncbi:hypothetical protein KOM00_04995 [Geomonas sp. Red69]|uniref:Apea-like HEPN domain-containing protein n=1 Tax=Geomonas diazotrophica TaxID=2843197 RepID=A0ABX8JKI7_9BACT|nr:MULTISPECIES: hypothetical protein [Geomonas]MBU5636083.1 hypothetical protein [Geomonas diazotrophica]QWV95985.1 hypothetical protein KP005_11370 [Geomonas nitrogeniifigens]QXE85052.1 hypothetical protein KP003_11645 [Geomonas nitrogeniifigens]